MKRIMALLLVSLVIVSVCTVSAYAQQATPDEPERITYLCYDRLRDWLGERLLEGVDTEGFQDYEELYFHYTDETQENYDWVLIRVVSNGGLAWFGKSGCNIGSRAIYSYDSTYFYGDMAIYDVKNDTFRSIVDYREFDGVKEAVEELELGVPLGDMDSDGRITVVDATIIQKMLAGIEVRPRYSEKDDIIERFSHWEDSDGGPLAVYAYCYISDYDQDGVRSVLDATHIQKHLASLE